MIHSLNYWSQAWTELILAISWQAAILIAIAAVAVALFRRASPVLRYWICQIVAIKICLMPLWTVAVPLPSFSADHDSQADLSSDAGDFHVLPAGDPGDDVSAANVESPRLSAALPNFSPWSPLRAVAWTAWLFAAWLLLVAVQFALLVRQCRSLRRLLRTSQPASNSLQSLVRDAAAELGLRHPPRAVVAAADCSFFICGIRRPTLVAPQGLLTTIDRDRLRQVVLHELAHVKRRDLLFGWPVEIARLLLFFHPLVHWLDYRLRLERELACDQIAMAASSQSPSEYVQTLVQVIAQASAPPVLRGAAISAGINGNENPGLKSQISKKQKEKQ